MSVGRRGFLRLLAAAPVAAPVVAREAAQKAGVGSVVGFGNPTPALGMSQAVPSSESGWIKLWAAEVFSKKWKDEQWQEIAMNPVGVLDPDLASSRSLSLSAAIRMQKRRNFERRVASHRRSVMSRFKEAFGFEFVPEDGA